MNPASGRSDAEDFLKREAGNLVQNSYACFGESQSNLLSANKTNNRRIPEVDVSKNNYTWNLCCKKCKLAFANYKQFYFHILKHVTLPKVVLRPISASFLQRLKRGVNSIRPVAVKHTSPYHTVKQNVVVPLKKPFKTQNLSRKLIIKSAKNRINLACKEFVQTKEFPNQFYSYKSVNMEVNQEVGVEESLNNEDFLKDPNDLGKGYMDEGEEESDMNTFLPEDEDESNYLEQNNESEMNEHNNSESEEFLQEHNEASNDGNNEMIENSFEDENDEQKDMNEMSGEDSPRSTSSQNKNLEPQSPAYSPPPNDTVNENESNPEEGYQTGSPTSHNETDNINEENNYDEAHSQQENSEFMPADMNDSNSHHESTNANFSWNDENDSGGDESDTKFKMETDPLMLGEPEGLDSNVGMNTEDGRDIFRGSDEDEMSRGEKESEDSHKENGFDSVTAESLGLQSEFISIEHLGETSVFRCEVCGERSKSPDSLEMHRSQARHYKSNQESCGGVVCGTAEELSSHKETAHAGTEYEGGPVEHMEQQVMGLLEEPLQENNSQNLTNVNSLSQVSITSLKQVSISPLPSSQVSISPISLSQVTFSPALQQSQISITPATQQPQIQARPINSLLNQQPSTKPSMIRLPQGVTIQPQGSSSQGRDSLKRSTPTPPSVNHIKQPRLMEALTSNQDDDPDCQIVSMQKPDITIRQSVNSSSGKGRSDAKSVANILATRGITVTPSGAASGSNKPPPQINIQKQPPMTSLNLNSAISITPAAGQNNMSGNFAVPQGRGPIPRQHHQPPMVNQVRTPTVDLTKDTPPPPRMIQQHYVGRGRPRGRSPAAAMRHTCHLCDKAFTTAESLAQHMLLHRSPHKLQFRCNQCNAQYSTQQALLQHRQTHHKEVPSIQQGAEVAIPVVDLKQPQTINRLRSLGIQHYIPLSQFMSQGHNVGLPIILMDGARLPMLSNVTTGVGASAILSLGSIRALPR